MGCGAEVGEDEGRERTEKEINRRKKEEEINDNRGMSG